MKSLIEQMRIYHRYHQKTATKLTHIVGIPLAIIPFLILLNWLHLSIPGLFYSTASWIAITFLAAYYFMLDWSLALIVTLVLIILNIITIALTGFVPSLQGLIWFVIIFAVAWGLQLLGHVFEGKRPALTDNLFQVFIAPLFIAAEILFFLGFRKDLQDQL